MDQIMSQLKAVKQELLAQLSRLSSATAPAAAAETSSAESTGVDAVPGWVADLVGRGAQCGYGAHRLSRDRATVVAYLEAVWLARRVWVWSICVACATMDLELLSGSVSVAAELFFGDCTGSPAAPTQAGASAAARTGGHALRSSYSLDGALTEAQLYAAAASAPSTTKATTPQSDLSARLREVGRPMLLQTHLQPAPDVAAEECEMRAFFCGLTCAGHVHKDPHDGVARGGSPACVRDAFWVRAVVLCYSIMVRDDTSAARLLSYFQELHRDVTETREMKSAAADDADGAAPPARKTRALCVAAGFVLLLAERLVDEDYGAVAQHLHNAGYAAACGTPNSSDAVTSADGLVFAELCPGGGVLMLFLVRLLAEHVVRRRWAEQGVGQAFRPVEPADTTKCPGVGSTATHRNRLGCALAESRQAARGQTRRPREADACAVHLCDAFQRTALCDMGGDWPLPPDILRTSIA